MAEHTIHMGMAPKSSGRSLDYSNPIIPMEVRIDEFGKYTIERFDGADPLHLLEARSAIYWHKLLTRDRLVSEQELVKMIRATELMTTLRYLPSDFDYHTKGDDLVLYAAITSLFDQLLIVSSRELVLHESFLKWLRVASGFPDRFIWMHHLQRGLVLIDAFRRGLLPAVLTEHLSSGISWRDDYLGRPRLPAPQKEQREQDFTPNA